MSKDKGGAPVAFLITQWSVIALRQSIPRKISPSRNKNFLVIFPILWGWAGIMQPFSFFWWLMGGICIRGSDREKVLRRANVARQ